MNKDQLQDYLSTVVIRKNKICSFYIRDNGFKSDIIRETSQFPFQSEISISERIFIFMNPQVNLFCEVCKTKKKKFISYILGYSKTCSLSCTCKSEEYKIEKKKSFLQRYGVEYPSQSKEIQEKIKETNKKKYGCNYFTQTQKFLEKRKETWEKNLGVKNPLQNEAIKQKVKNTNIEKYGVSCNLFKETTVRKKIEDLHFQKYGVINPMKRKEIQEKVKRTSIEKYGMFVTQVESTKKKKRETFLNRYGNEVASKSNEVREKIRLWNNQKSYQSFLNELQRQNISSIDNITFDLFCKRDIENLQVKLKCNTCGNFFTDGLFLNYNRFQKCLTCFPYKKTKAEVELKEYLSGLFDTTMIENDRKILSGKELDLYVPDYNLAIEYNGLMYHSIGTSKYSMFNNSDFESDLKSYHLDKTERCVQQGIQLLHIFENEWLNSQKQDIWKSIIKSKLRLNDRVYARSLVIQPVSYQESCDFLDNNHLQGADKSSIRLGLYNPQGEILSLMTFGKSRYDKKVAWELLRFSTKKGITVVGGASKLFTHFKNNYLQDEESIVSYADRRHSSGNLYEKLGFTLSHISEPNYFYFTENSLVLESRLNYQRHKLKDRLAIFDESLTESENMYNNGYRKIYDSGNLVYVYK